MIPVEYPASRGSIWRPLFEERRATLIAVAQMLLHCRVAPEQILDKAIAALDGSPVRESFQSASAIRAVVKAALAHNREVANSRTEDAQQDPAKQQCFQKPAGDMLPWLERAVYFLRRVLRYSRRDTALLIGISDANIDQLCDTAEKRICHFRQPSFCSRTDASGITSQHDRELPLRTA